MIGLMLTVILTCGTALVETSNPSARVHGDLIVGALFSVHHTPRGGQGALVCGPIRELYGIQRVETALITLDKINRDTSILPGVTLGLEARDSCWSAPVALQQSIELVRDAITPAFTQQKSSGEIDNTVCVVDPTKTRSVKKAPLIGVVGPGSSSVALQVQNLLQLFSIPQIGYSSTSKVLSDKTRFSTFLRVVPSDYYQAQLLVDLVRYFNWTYVSIVSTDENYGQSGIQEFRDMADQSGVCVARENSVLSTAEDSVFDSVIMNLDQDHAANIVVCFCEGMTMRGLLAASKRMNLTGRFVFIGSDGWADRDDVVEGLESEAWGSLSIRIHSPYVHEFDDHYFSLNPFNNSRNPWFSEFWQHKFNCVLPEIANEGGSFSISTTKLGAAKTICTGKEKLSERYKQDPKMSFVMKSFWAMAHGLHSMLEDICGRSYHGVCKEVHPFNGTLFKNHLMNVSFTFGEEEVEFDRRGDPPGRYEILNYQLMPNGTYAYVQIGDWNNGTLTFSSYPQSRETELVKSVCSKPCPPGYSKNFKTGGQEKKCCWACVPCADHEYTDENQMNCIPCPDGQWPNENKTDCYVIPVEHVTWGNAQAVVAMSFSGLGLLATFATCRIFIRHNNTPVVKASTRELSYLILAGMTLAHISVFPILAKPTRISCALSRLMPGTSFAMIYASLFTKTNRIARILAGSKKRFPTRKPRFMSAAAQIVITCILILIETAVATAMLVIEPPMPHLEYPARNRAALTCSTTPRAVLTPLACDAVLLGLCTLYAVKTRNVPENFNEAKFIGFAMYTTCVIWIAFVPIYFGSETKVITMCMCVTLSASVTLTFLFFPKLYIIILRPEKNNRALFTTSKSIRCHIGTRVAAAIVEPTAKQAIYRLSTPEDADYFDRNNILRRTLSVQTGKELLMEFYDQIHKATPPLVIRSCADSNEEILNEDAQKCKGDVNMCESNENLTCSTNDTFQRQDSGSQQQLNHSPSEIALGEFAVLEKNEKNLHVIGPQLQSTPWQELNAKTLIQDLQKRSLTSACPRNERKSSACNGRNVRELETNTELNKKDYDPKLAALPARILEENVGLANGEDPLLNITITLGSGFS